MAHATEFDQGVLHQIANGVARSLPIGFRQYAGQLQLAETFEVWTLETPLGATEDMNRETRATDTYHHQIVVKGRRWAVGFARSRRSSEGHATWEVTQIFDSPVARQIDEAIAKVDQLVTTDALARLVLAPEFQLGAFWFLEAGKDPCYVVYCPGDLFEGADFLRRLKQEKPILGLLHGRPTP